MADNGEGGDDMSPRRGDRQSGYQPGDVFLSYLDFMVLVKAMPLLIILFPFWALFALGWWMIKWSFILMVVWPPRAFWWLLGKCYDGLEVVLRKVDRKLSARRGGRR